MISALILAGGRATRMGGAAKPALLVGGETIFARQLRVLAPRVSEVIVSVAESGVAPELPELSGHRLVADAVPNAGPLAGIAAGLAAATTPWLLVVAGDMPALSPELVDRLVARAADDVDAVGIRVNGLPEPLLCALRVAAARPAVEQLLAVKRYKASALLTETALRVAWLVDVDASQVKNINSPEDLI